MRDKLVPALWAVAIAAALVVVSFVIGFEKGQNHHAETHGTVNDTIYHTEVITVPNPPLLTSRLGALIRIPVHDTIRVRDTLYVEVPREIKTYGDSTFQAVISGYKPSLDFLELYTPVKTVAVKQPSRKFSIVLTTGFGVQYGILNKTLDVGPGVMIGVGYHF